VKEREIVVVCWRNDLKLSSFDASKDGEKKNE